MEELATGSDAGITSVYAKSFADDGFSVIPGFIPTELLDDMR
jgi:hypothetical protein